MKKIISCVLVAIAGNVFAASPVGLWKTIDDVSGEPKSIVSITESQNKQLSGKVVKLFKDPGRLCTACEGEAHNKPIVGLTVMQGLQPNKKEGLWENGQILDPKNGKTYHCTARLLDNGMKLQVRGYIGLPLFGRSQIWERIKETKPRP
jgi:uncharacterized protein (DUF2147 family)